jgi:hypothetical protein
MVENVAQQKWDIQHIDVKSVFLNGNIQKKVYVTQPLGFARDNEECSVYHLHKALYGVRQAPRTWNTKLDITLKDLGFTSSLSEHTWHGEVVSFARGVCG